MGSFCAIWRRAAGWAGSLLEKHSLRMRAGVACVGLVVLAGSLTLLVTPDPPEEQVFPIAQMPTVVIDAGHGGKDEGAKCKGVQEKTLALDVALRLGRILNARGFSTTQTRTEDVFLTLAERTEIANRVKDPAIFVSIHFNQGSGREIAGIETFYADNKVPTITDWTWVGFFSRPESFDMGEELAAEVQYAAILKTGAKDRGIRARHLFVTRHTRLPAVLVEGGFITNRMESTLLNEEHYADTLAAGIADGIESWWRTQQKSLPSSLARKE